MIMTKQPNTSNKGELSKCIVCNREFKMKGLGMNIKKCCSKICKTKYNSNPSYYRMYPVHEQGYAKALDDVTKILNELCLKCPIQDDKECWCKPLEIALKEIAKLNHSQQDKQDRQCLNQHSSGGSADTHIPKLAKEKTKIDRIMNKIYPKGTYELGEHSRIRMIIKEELK